VQGYTSKGSKLGATSSNRRSANKKGTNIEKITKLMYTWSYTNFTKKRLTWRCRLCPRNGLRWRRIIYKRTWMSRMINIKR
jgi:hypothetical protein